MGELFWPNYRQWAAIGRCCRILATSRGWTIGG